MGQRSSYERMNWWQERLFSKRHPKIGECSQTFECSQRTASRDIEYLRDRLCWPIEYDFTRKGYFLSRDHAPPFELSLNQEEWLTIMMAERVLHGQTGKLSLKLKKIIDNYLSEAGRGDEPSKITSKISYVPQAEEKIDEMVFNICLSALVHKRAVSIKYYNPHKDETTHRTISPQHLLNLSGNWYLVSYCHKNEKLQNFMPGRMDQVKIKKDAAFFEVPRKTVDRHISSSFGAFKGRTVASVVLLFSKKKANWVKRQFWHKDKKIISKENGQLELHLPVADYTEITGMILQQGADVEVLAPDDLRRIVKDEIKKMGKIYS